MALDSGRITVTEGAVGRALSRKRLPIGDLALQGLLLLSLIVCLGFLIILLTQVITAGWSVFSDRGVDFLTSGLSRNPEQAGVWQGIIGSLEIAFIVAVVAFPLGIATAVHLEEYAGDSRFTRFINLNIRNLAGVPSVVYGILGLVIFVQFLGRDLTRGGGLTGGPSVISAGLTMSILVLPIVIITTAEALRAVPQSLREGGYGVGATRWEVTRSLVLPAAAPGILTGTILAFSRAIGEAAPLILIGAIYGSGFLATSESASITDQVRGPFTAMPMIVLGWTRTTGGFRDHLAPAAIMVLLAVTLLCNAVAVVLRNRFEKRW